jgi:cell division protein FtsW
VTAQRFNPARADRSPRWLPWATGTITAVLALVGCFSVATAQRQPLARGDSWSFSSSQFHWCIAGFALMIGLGFIDVRRVQPWLGVVLAACVFVLLASDLRPSSSRSEIHLGQVDLNPAPLLVVAFGLWLASYLVSRRPPGRRVLVWPAVVLSVCVALIALERDSGSVAAAIAVAFVVIFVCGESVVDLLVAGLGLVVIGSSLVALSGRSSEIAAVLRPQSHRWGSAYEMIEGQLALAHGGLLGRGAGAGIVKSFLPNASHQMVLGVVGEEKGFLAVAVVIFCFIALVWFAFTCAATCSDLLGTLTATAAATYFLVASAASIATIGGVAPVMRFMLPFVSADNGVTLAGFAAAGLIISVSRIGPPRTANIVSRRRQEPDLTLERDQIAWPLERAHRELTILIEWGERLWVESQRSPAAVIDDAGHWFQRVLRTLIAVYVNEGPSLDFTKAGLGKQGARAIRTRPAALPAMLTDALERLREYRDSLPLAEQVHGRATGWKVFLVHGHDQSKRDAAEAIITSVWGEPPTILVNEPSGSVGNLEKLEDFGDQAAFVVVLLTADDYALQGHPVVRARQNVIFEAGFFIGRLGRQRVKILVEPGVELPSDLKGAELEAGLNDGGAWEASLRVDLKQAREATFGRVGRADETSTDAAASDG